MIRVVGFDPGPTFTGVACLGIGAGRGTWLEADKVYSTLKAIDGWLTRCKPHLVAVERPIWLGRRSGACGAPLLDTGIIAGGIAWLAEARGFSVVVLSANQWRGVLCRRAAVKDRVVAEALARFVALPTSSNEHERDAMGLALVASWTTAGRVARSVYAEQAAARRGALR